MTEHYWMRKREILGDRAHYKPPCDSRAVIETARVELTATKRREAARAAAKRLWLAMEAWRDCAA